jgi:hypothetical protein
LKNCGVADNTKSQFIYKKAVMQTAGCRCLLIFSKIFKEDLAGRVQRYALAPIAPGLSLCSAFL